MEKTFNGWLNIFKEKGITSFSISKAIKKNFKFKKVGHLGTLRSFSNRSSSNCSRRSNKIN